MTLAFVAPPISSWSLIRLDCILIVVLEYNPIIADREKLTVSAVNAEVTVKASWSEEYEMAAPQSLAKGRDTTHT